LLVHRPLFAALVYDSAVRYTCSAGPWCQTRQLTAHPSLLLLLGAGRLHVVLYEELVQHPEPVMRRLLQRCGLEWQDAVLAPHNLTRHVHTASSTQVGGWVDG